MLSERTIINGLLLLGGMILGPYLIVLTLEMNQFALLSFFGLIFLFSIFFFVKDRIAVFPFIGSYFAGSLNFLPLGFTLIEVFSLVSIFYYLINYVALKQRPISVGPKPLLLPILVIGAIVLYHDHHAGLKVLGSGQEGSRPGLFIIVAIVAYICAINIPSPSATFLRRVPFYCFVLTLCSAIPFLLTTLFPSLAPIVYYISGNVNLTAYTESIAGANASDVDRNGAIASIGGALQGIMLCYYPIATWWRPKRWILVILSIVCFFCVLLSGYRNTLFSFVLITLFSTLCYSRWRILILLPLFILIPLGTIILQNDHPYGVQLPATMQRSMSFLPGNWDADVMSSASSSNDFRADIIRVYKNEYLSKSPWIGNGFTFDPNESEGLAKMYDSTSSAYDKQYYQSKDFIVTKNFHTGWLSLYDAVGIIGGIAFVMLDVYLIWMTVRFVFGPNETTHSRIFPLKVFIFASLLTSSIGFFTTFGSFSQSFIGMCVMAVVLVHIGRLQTQNTSSPSSLPPIIPVQKKFSSLTIPAR